MKARQFLSFVLVLVLSLSCLSSNAYADDLYSEDTPIEQLADKGSLPLNVTFRSYNQTNLAIKTLSWKNSNSNSSSVSASYITNMYGSVLNASSQGIYLEFDFGYNKVLLLNKGAKYQIYINDIIANMAVLGTGKSVSGVIGGGVSGGAAIDNRTLKLASNGITGVTVKYYNSSGTLISSETIKPNFGVGSGDGLSFVYTTPELTQDVYRMTFTFTSTLEKLYPDVKSLNHNSFSYAYLFNIGTTANSNIMVTPIRSSDEALDNMSNGITGIFDGIQGIFKSIVLLPSLLWNLMESSFDSLIGYARDTFTTVNVLPTAIWEKMSGSFTSLITHASNIYTKVTNLPSDLWSKMSTSFANLINGNTNIFTEVGKVFNSVNSLPGLIWKEMEAAFSELSLGIKSISTDIWKNMSGSFTSLITHASNIFNKVNSLPGDIWSKMSGAFVELSTHAANIWKEVQSLPSNIVDGVSNGIHNLFVPSSIYLEDYSEKFQDLLVSRFGALYQSFHFVTDFFKGFKNKEAIDVIDIPLTTILLPEIYGDGKVDFSFGGYQVDVVPEGIEFFVEILKWVISAVCTLSFVNSLKNRIYNEFLGGAS